MSGIATLFLELFRGMLLFETVIDSAYSCATEQGDQLVRGAKLTWTQLRWNDRFQDADSLRDVNSQVVLGCLDVFVAEPQGHFANIARCLEDIERTGMAPMFPAT